MQRILTFSKESGKTYHTIQQQIENTLSGTQKNRTEIVYQLASKLAATYQQRLRETNMIDFADMITQATDLLQKQAFNTPYKLVLVDEFQDISKSRAKLLKAVLQSNRQTKLFAVGGRLAVNLPVRWQRYFSDATFSSDVWDHSNSISYTKFPIKYRDHKCSKPIHIAKPAADKENSGFNQSEHQRHNQC